MSTPAEQGIDAARREAAPLHTRAEALEERWEALRDEVEALMMETERVVEDDSEGDRTERYTAAKVRAAMTKAHDGADDATVFLRKLKLHARS